MVQVREARRAYKEFHTSRFWSFDPDYLVTEKDVPWVASRLMEFGGREGWARGTRLCPAPLKEAVSVSRAGESTKVEWVHDTAWRFLPALKNDLVGYTLHPLDLAVNKLLALVGRDEPRDFLDTILIHKKTLCLGAIIWAATAKDPGFTPPMLLGMLRRRGRFHPEDFARLALSAEPDLVELKRTWLDALESAEAFISSRPKTEIGCLYYSPARRLFPRDPTTEADVVPHYGRPGGVLPIVGA